VLLAVCQAFEIENEAIPRIGFYFGGGMGNTGSVCGAVCGAIMAFGLMRDRPDSMEESLRAFTVAQEFRRRFEAEMGTISCRELTGADLSTVEGIQQFVKSDTHSRVCLAAVGVAYRLVMDLLDDPAFAIHTPTQR
jgi:C_GCAxxG_C_C family probable redox protein